MAIEAEEAARRIGETVTYKPFKGCSPDIWEYGTITSVKRDLRVVFVRYDTQHQQADGKATNPDDLFWGG